jgi:hypothetical protein
VDVVSRTRIILVTYKHNRYSARFLVFLVYLSEICHVISRRHEDLVDDLKSVMKLGVSKTAPKKGSRDTRLMRSNYSRPSRSSTITSWSLILSSQTTPSSRKSLAGYASFSGRYRGSKISKGRWLGPAASSILRMTTDGPNQILDEAPTVKGTRQPLIQTGEQRLASLVKVQVTSKLPDFRGSTWRGVILSYFRRAKS